jgi:signal peptidase
MSSATTTVRHARPPRGGHALATKKTSEAPISAPARGRAKSIVLAVAGVLGMLCILWLIVSLVFGFSAIVFKTGSMAPTMPTGSVALERPIAAADIRVGDVVTVPVPGQVLPVTHRVVKVSRDPANASDRVLVLKGDANLTADQIPYTVSAAKLVLASVPVGGTILALLHTPLFIGITCLLVAALLFWAFWPARSQEPRPRYARSSAVTVSSSKGHSHVARH